MIEWVLRLLLQWHGSLPRRIPSVWRATRDALDLEAAPLERTPLRFQGIIEGREVVLFVEDGALPTDRQCIVLRVSTRLDLTVRPASWVGKDQEIGDGELDALAQIDGGELEVQAVLGPLERRELRSQLRRGDARFSLDQRRLELRRKGRAPAASWLVQNTRDLIRLASLLEGDRPLEQRLLARVRTEPRPETRLFALQQALHLLDLETARSTLDNALYDSFGPVRAAAAAALGRTDVLTELEAGQLTLVEGSGSLTLLSDDP